MPRPEGNRWVNSSCYIANYCPKPIGGDHRVFFALIGRKWVYLATGYNQRAKWTRNQWDDYLKKMNTPEIKRRHGGKEVIQLLDIVKDAEEIPLLPADPDKGTIEKPLTGQLQLF
tara:strand:- start:486 stop:830 length:345 start_codon:yes stop_codon:yes gene_type:complete